MNTIIKNIKSDKTLFWGFSISFILIAFNTLYVYIHYKHLPPLVPLYNQMPWGDYRLGQKPEIFIPIAIAAAIFLFNLSLSSILHKKMPLTSRISCITVILISIFVLLIILRTLNLVI